MLPWIDSHCHLDRYEDPKSVVARARDAGVSAMVAVSTHPDTFEKLVPLTMEFQDVFASVGLHPCDAETMSVTELRSWLELGVTKGQKIIALGETGLDNRPTSPPLDIQRDAFEEHIRVSINSGLPLIVHTRNCDDEFLRIMRNVRKTWHGGTQVRGVLHCFTGSVECAQEAVDWGWKISLSGIVTFKSAPEVHQLARCVPLNALMLETDAPWLAPAPYRGKVNEPAFVVHTAQAVALLRDCSLSELSQTTVDATKDLFVGLSQG